MGKKIQLAGEIFGKLTVIKEIGKYKTTVLWLCVCDCGNEKVIRSASLISGNTTSCGCLQIEVAKVVNKTHGSCINYSVSPEYRAWQHLKERCYNKNNKGYKNYGGRGIIVCDRWLGEKGFINFLYDMGLRPSPKHSIDRFPNNNTGIYEKENCRWATKREQVENRRNSIWIEHEGETMLMADWGKRLGIHHDLIRYHLKTGKEIKDIIERFKKKAA